MGQEEEIIPLFNQFFSSLPRHRSYDMAFKVYLQELADVQDKTLTIHSTRSSTKDAPICIASYDKNKNKDSDSDRKVIQEPLSKTNREHPNCSTRDSCNQLINRKQRSLINLIELNKLNGVESKPYQDPTSPQQDPPTIYENVKKGSMTSTLATSAPLTMPSFKASTSKSSISSSFGINQDGWFIVSSKPLKISNDLKVDLRDLF